MRCFLIVLAVGLVATPLLASNPPRNLATIAGKVYLLGTESPLERVEVTAVSPYMTPAQSTRCGGPRMPRANTQRDGSFVITQVEAGGYSVVATRLGYVTATVSDVAVDSTGIAFVTIYMERSRVPRGTISGIVFDEECGHPIERAHVFIDARHASARTEKNGTFELTDLPAGSYTIQVNGEGSHREIEGVEVHGDRVTEITVALPPFRSNDEMDLTVTHSNFCHVHRRTMDKLLVTTGYGLRAFETDGIRTMLGTFPFAEPFRDGGCVIRPAYKTWGYRCRGCIAARNRWVVDATWTDPDTTLAAGFATYRVPDIVTLSAPGGLEESHDADFCDATGILENDSLRIQYHFGPRAIWPAQRRDDWRFGDAIDGCYAGINASQEPAGGSLPYVVGAWFGGLPGTTDRLSVSVWIRDPRQRPQALAILRSIRLGGHESGAGQLSGGGGAK